MMVLSGVIARWLSPEYLEIKNIAKQLRAAYTRKRICLGVQERGQVYSRLNLREDAAYTEAKVEHFKINSHNLYPTS